MARSAIARIQSVFTLPSVALLAPLALAVGCQSANHATSDMPAPNFAGPIVEQPLKIPPVQPKIVEAPPKVVPAKPVTGIPPAWVPLANAEKRQWKWIVIHHSATSVGGAKRFDRDHQSKGWDELGYHFVIGNGTDTGDGLVEVGGRWPVQKHGAHAKTPSNEYNERGIGICLVGNFDETRPTAKQMASLTKLVAYLADKYKISQNDIIGHKMTGKQTDCPGTNLDIAAIRATVARQRTALSEEPPKPTGELMQSASR